MTEDRTAKLYAGQMGIIAVLVNVLIDKGVITESELRERFEQAHEAARQCSGGPGIAVVLEDMLAYLEPARRGRMRDKWHVLELVVAGMLTAGAIAWLIAFVAIWAL